MSQRDMKEWIKCYPIYEMVQSGDVAFNTKISMSSLTSLAPEILVKAIRDAVYEYSKEHLAKDMSELLRPLIEKELQEQLCKKVSEDLFAEVLGKVDLDSVAKLATVRAAKDLAKDIGS